MAVKRKPAAKKSAKKTTARKATSKKAAKKKPAKKATARKPAKKAAATKKTAKKVAPKKKATVKKATVKKATAKKATAKKATAKKATAKKAAKKTATKKPALKKASAKKAAPKKASAKKASAKKAASEELITVKVAPPRSAKKLPKLIIKRKSNGAGPAKETTKKRARKLTPKQLDDFKMALIVMRDQLAGQVNSLRGDSLQRHDEVNTSEDGTDAFERQFALNLASTEQDGIWEIDEALRRIDQGVFGICEMTGDSIELERLRAIPFTRHSLAAQAEIESRRGLNRQSAVRRGLM